MDLLEEVASIDGLSFLEFLEALVVVIVVSFLLRLKAETRRGRQELDQEWRQQRPTPRQDRQRQDPHRRYQAFQQQQRAARRQQPQPRRRQGPEPETEHVSQQGATPSSPSEQGNSECALCENCQRFFRLHLSGPSQRTIPHSETSSVIRQNAINGCSVCAVISRKLKDRPVTADKPVAFTIEHGKNGWHLWSPDIDIQLGVVPVRDSTSKRTAACIFLVELGNISNFANCGRPQDAFGCLGRDTGVSRRNE